MRRPQRAIWHGLSRWLCQWNWYRQYRGGKWYRVRATGHWWQPVYQVFICYDDFDRYEEYEHPE